MKYLLIAALSLSVSAMAEGLPETVSGISVNKSNVLKFDQKLACGSLTACMTDKKSLEDKGNKSVLKANKSGQYLKVAHKYDCNNECFSDIESFITSKLF